MRERHLRSSLLPAALFVSLAIGATVVSAGVVVPRDAHASVAIAASLEDVARASSVIARVTALDRESTWEDGRIVTYNRVRLDTVIGGAAPAGARELRIRTLGGRVGNIGQIVEGEASLTTSESSLVFLTARSSDFVVAGRAQGQLLIQRDVHGREIVRMGRVGELLERRVHPPLRAVGRRMTELDGAAFESVAAEAKRAWEVGHAK